MRRLVLHEIRRIYNQRLSQKLTLNKSVSTWTANFKNLWFYLQI